MLGISLKPNAICWFRAAIFRVVSLNNKPKAEFKHSAFSLFEIKDFQ
jgi:hypothetical protein